VQDNEVDFIIQEKFAYEVKFNEHTIQQSKYKLFREKYPKIPLEFITFDDILERIVEGTL
jgi:predicted AAA+ superfamily ATPase